MKHNTCFNLGKGEKAMNVYIKRKPNGVVDDIIADAKRRAVEMQGKKSESNQDGQKEEEKVKE